MNRTIERNMAELRTLRAERRAAREQALEEAVLLAQLAQSKGEKYDPAADFPPQLKESSLIFQLPQSPVSSQGITASTRPARYVRWASGLSPEPRTPQNPRKPEVPEGRTSLGGASGFTCEFFGSRWPKRHTGGAQCAT